MPIGDSRISHTVDDFLQVFQVYAFQMGHHALIPYMSLLRPLNRNPKGFLLSLLSLSCFISNSNSSNNNNNSSSSSSGSGSSIIIMLLSLLSLSVASNMLAEILHEAKELALAIRHSCLLMACIACAPNYQ